MLPSKIRDAESLETEDGRFAEGDGRVRRQKRTCDEGTNENTCHHNQVPRFAFPIVFQEVQVIGYNRGAHVPKRRAHTEGAVEENQVQWDHQSDDRPGHIPWPRLTDPLNEF